jgi:hypothetical protein
MKFDQKSLWETAKFVARMAILVGLPLATEYLLSLEGVLGEIVAVILPILDKWVHENKSIKATGVVPF